jgi:protein tyrosine phosphatase (PTP) superfamily phosphohydrolase (DUF442 family)
MFLWEVDNLLLAGQPGEQSFEILKEMGVTKVVNLRGESEMDFSFEIEACSRLEIGYVQFPLVEAGELIAQNCERLSSMIDDNEKWFIHCGSANRIAGWLMTYLTKYRKMTFEQATEIAMNNGLTNPGFIEQARNIVNK